METRQYLCTVTASVLKLQDGQISVILSTDLDDYKAQLPLNKQYKIITTASMHVKVNVRTTTLVGVEKIITHERIDNAPITYDEEIDTLRCKGLL